MLAAFGVGSALAETPRSIRILVGFPPGGGTDAIARLLSERLRDELGVPVIVENRPGAGGQIAAQALKAAAPDGTTYFISHDHTISILPLVMKNPGFDPARDFVPVAGFATFVNALALSGGTPAPQRSGEYVAWVKAQGGKSAIGVPAPASVPEFLVKVIGEKYGLDLVAVPYRGSAPMIGDMLGNQIAAGIGSVPDFVENHKAGKMRVVAVLGATRQAAMPDVPTFAELGLAGFEDVPYYAFFAPVGTPQAEIDRFSAALAKVIAAPETKDKLTTWGLTVGLLPQAQLAARASAPIRRPGRRSSAPVVSSRGGRPAAGRRQAARSKGAASAASVRAALWRIRWSKADSAAFAPSPRGDDDLLVGHRRRVAGGEHARHAGRALRVDHDLAVLRQLDRAAQPLGVGHQADLHEHAGQFDLRVRRRWRGRGSAGRSPSGRRR